MGLEDCVPGQQRDQPASTCKFPGTVVIATTEQPVVGSQTLRALRVETRPALVSQMCLPGMDKRWPLAEKVVLSTPKRSAPSALFRSYETSTRPCLRMSCRDLKTSHCFTFRKTLHVPSWLSRCRRSWLPSSMSFDCPKELKSSRERDSR